MTNATDPGDLLSKGAGAVVQALAQRRWSALDLCDAAIARIKRLDGAINALIVRDFDHARQQARAADALLARGEWRPLLGVPMTVKESFDVAGLPTTWGLPPCRNYVPTEDAVLVQRLKRAGAVILGKTNVAPGLGDWQSDNPIYGRTTHPLDARRTPGGSSGGAAAALAAGMVALELGSDIGGSIRVPAHFCGIYGYKPSQSVLPKGGHEFPGGGVAAPDVLSVVGPLAHNAADLNLALDVLAGPDAPAASAWTLALPAPRAQALRDWRVLALDSHPVAATSAEVRGAVAAACATLEGGGAAVERNSPLLPDLARMHADYRRLLLTLIQRRDPKAKSPLSAGDWLALLDRRASYQRQWRALFGQFDAMICPPFGTVAFEHVEEPDWNARTLPIDGQPTPYAVQSAWAGIASLSGLPATVAPVAATAGGLPIGIQIIGGWLQDRTTIALARTLGQAQR